MNMFTALECMTLRSSPSSFNGGFKIFDESPSKCACEEQALTAAQEICNFLIQGFAALLISATADQIPLPAVGTP